MADATETTTKGRVARRPRAWWQWGLGIGLLAAAGVLLVVRFYPELLPARPFLVEPREIRVAPALRASDVFPAAPGDLSGCNLLLVTFDTTRADRIGCYGNDGIRTPTLDRLAREGVLFSKAICPAPVTLPSHSSMMTGLYPYHHGARANSRFRLRDENRTLAEVLSEHGYMTGAAISAFVLDSRFGIDQGFAEYDDDLGEAQRDVGLLDIAERSAEKTTQRAITWLKTYADGPFFLWVHYFDPHQPWEPPKRYGEQYDLPYDAEIAFADAQFGDLLDILDELGATDKTLVVMAGDHGEGLGQHQEATHSFLVYDSTTHVPLIMRCGTRLGGGVHVDRLVSLVDIMPTVLSLLGVDGPDSMDGVDLTQPPSGDRRVFFEAIQPLADYGWAPLLGVREEAIKYIYGPEDELYDLSGDPFERENLVSSRADLAAALKKHLRAFFGEDLEEAGSAQPTEHLSAEEMAKLRALGYLGGDVGEAPPPASRPHPKKMMGLLARAYAALDIEREKGLDAAIAVLEDLVEEHPDFTVGYDRLGDAYFRNDQPEEAEAAFRRSLDIRPDQPQTLLYLARLGRRRNRAQEAILLYRQVLSQVPTDLSTLLELGQLLLERGEFGEAADVVKKALIVAPRNDAAPEMLATAMAAIDRTDEAIGLLRKELDSQPNLPMVRNALARLLVGKNLYAEAVAMLREGIRLAPEKRELTNNLAFMLVNCPDEKIRNPLEAAVLMERVCDETKHRDPRYLHSLAMVYASLFRMDEAITVSRKAHQIALASDDPKYAQLAPAIGMSMEAYKRAKARGISPTMGMGQPTTQPASQGPQRDDDKAADDG